MLLCEVLDAENWKNNNATLVPFRISRDVAWSLSLLIVVLRVVDALNIIHLVSTTSAERCTYWRVCVLVGQYLHHVELILPSPLWGETQKTTCNQNVAHSLGQRRGLSNCTPNGMALHLNWLLKIRFGRHAICNPLHANYRLWFTGIPQHNIHSPIHTWLRVLHYFILR